MSNKERGNIILENMEKVIIGKTPVLEKVLVCLLARGHVLIEDVPGVGKTTMVKALARSLNLSFGRIQFTPDLMPADLLGMTIYNQQDNSFSFRKGPIFHQIILADEINRTSPKTQSSLLQAMEEGEVSIDSHTYPLKKPFMVLATQNPVEYQGTFPLPEAQLDRFLMRVSLGYPDAEHEMAIVRHPRHDAMSHLTSVAEEADLLAMQAGVERVYAAPEVIQYIVSLVNASRNHPDIYLGASPRASIDLLKSGKALAYLRGREYVIPDDIKENLASVLCHRLMLSAEARIEGKGVETVVLELLKKIYTPAVDFHEA
ncbi:MoxR family ATPase [Anoxynatronum sibiricum]|uniref:MoxR family ATPase n=1 Tax=Anoxynatronum sibiricum TaxID=210623 RepID=A0ABM6B344_9CLOT